MKPNAKFYPSKGPHGSVFQTDDGAVYCRTHQGIRKIDHSLVGRSLVSHQQAMYTVLRLHRKMMLTFGGIMLVLGVVFGHFVL